MPATADDDAAEGESLLEAGRFMDAAAAFGRAIAGDPARWPLYHRRGVALIKAKMFDEALASFDEAIARCPDQLLLSVGLWVARGEACEELGRAEEAIRSYDAALVLEPGSRAARLSKALILWELDDPVKTAEAFETLMDVVAGDLGPDAAILYLHRKMTALDSLRSNEEKLQFLDAVLARRPALGHGWLLRGNLLREQGRVDEAFESYTKGLHSAPDHDEIWEARGDLLREGGDRPHAEEAYREALRAIEGRYAATAGGGDRSDRSRLADLSLRRGDLLAKLGDGAGALASFDQAIEMSTAPSVPWRAKAHYLREAGRFEDALRAYEQASALVPDDIHSHFFRSYVLRELGRTQDALGAIEEALKIHPAWPEGLKFKGHLQVNLGQFSEAADTYGAAAGEDGEDHEAWYLRGLALYYAGDAEAAVRSFREALEIAPGDPETLEMTAHALAAVGKSQESSTHFDLAIHAGGQPPRLLFAKGKVLLGAGDLLGALEAFRAAGAAGETDGYDLYGYLLVAAQRQEYAEAFRLIESVLLLNPSLVGLLRTDPALEPLRGLPRFVELLGPVEVKSGAGPPSPAPDAGDGPRS